MVIKLVFKIAMTIVIIMCDTDCTCMKVGNHKEVIKIMSHSGQLTHEYDMGSRFRGYMQQK